MGQSKSTKIIIKTKSTLLHPLLLFIFQIRIYVSGQYKNLTLGPPFIGQVNPNFLNPGGHVPKIKAEKNQICVMKLRIPSRRTMW